MFDWLSNAGSQREDKTLREENIRLKNDMKKLLEECDKFLIEHKKLMAEVDVVKRENIQLRSIITALGFKNGVQ